MKTTPDSILAAAPGVRVVRRPRALGIVARAAQLGVDRRTLKRWLDRETVPTPQHRAAAEALGIVLPAPRKRRRRHNPRKASNP